jgi:hypothetical protein
MRTEHQLNISHIDYCLLQLVQYIAVLAYSEKIMVESAPLIKHFALKKYGRSVVLLHAFLTSAAAGDAL